jgi:hypothetical protein
MSEKIKGFFECPLVKLEMCSPYTSFILKENEAGVCRKCGKSIRLIECAEFVEAGREYPCKAYQHVDRDRIDLKGLKIAHSVDSAGLDRRYFIG